MTYLQVDTGVYVDTHDGQGLTPISCTEFPYGELCVSVEPIISLRSQMEDMPANVWAIWKGPKTFDALLQTIDALQIAGVEIGRVTLPYFPYSRQDVLHHSGESCSYQLFYNVLKSKVKNIPIVTWDVHGYTPPGLQSDKKLIEMVGRATKDLDEVTVVFPDKGAEKRFLNDVASLQNFTSTKITTITGSKTREGSVNVQLSGNVEDGPVFVVDDLCDGGTTFVSVAKILSHVDRKNLTLIVTHMRDWDVPNLLMNYYGEIIFTNSRLVRPNLHPEAVLRRLNK